VPDPCDLCQRCGAVAPRHWRRGPCPLQKRRPTSGVLGERILKPPDNLACRDAIRGMPLAFNAHAARGLRAVIQFRITGAEPGDYYLHIADGECVFHEGIFHAPNVSIHARSDVWLAIAHGELDGTLAYLTGRYRVEGDVWLLMRLKSLFAATGDR